MVCSTLGLRSQRHRRYGSHSESAADFARAAEQFKRQGHQWRAIKAGGTSGKFDRELQPGLSIVLPVVERW